MGQYLDKAGMASAFTKLKAYIDKKASESISIVKLTLAEYNQLSDAEKNNERIMYAITDISDENEV